MLSVQFWCWVYFISNLQHEGKRLRRRGEDVWVRRQFEKIVGKTILSFEKSGITESERDVGHKKTVVCLSKLSEYWFSKDFCALPRNFFSCFPLMGGQVSWGRFAQRVEHYNLMCPFQDWVLWFWKELHASYHPFVNINTGFIFYYPHV